eukprot:CAMPEP_0172424784 /NCGR_PEP_ID=MMETSP1064-20121228/28240_1 /TAXON_ID=202472 /ORGANISM="Aulacoseira subarctica , Strain CCAP 1002/5" /LENGTH=245 /DNA_ID=CAMNT_0013167175 /DNA_START=45 /DNA_END=779 /DNA_ORIENTATION=+
MTDTKSFVDSVFLARFGLCRLNALDYFLHPLNPFRSSSSSTSSSSSNEVLAMQGISMGTLMAASSATGATNPNSAQQQAEEEYATMLSRMKGEQYELLPPPPEHDLSAPSPLYVIRHVLRSNPTTVKVLGIYYILEGVIYKSPPVRSIRKATIAKTIEAISQAYDALSVCARYEPGFGYYFDFFSNDDNSTTTMESVSSTSQRQKRRRRILDKNREERTEEEEEGIRASEAIDRIMLRLSKKNVL